NVIVFACRPQLRVRSVHDAGMSELLQSSTRCFRLVLRKQDEIATRGIGWRHIGSGLFSVTNVKHAPGAAIRQWACGEPARAAYDVLARKAKHRKGDHHG